MIDKDKKSGIQFDPTINLGHILTFIGFLGVGFIAYQTLEKRVLILESNTHRQDLRDSTQDIDRLRISVDAKEAFSEIKRAIEKLDSKIEIIHK